jgi:tetratricopeptide (TPR) repeat protein
MTRPRPEHALPALGLAALLGAAWLAPPLRTRADDGVRARHEPAQFWRRVSQPNVARSAALLASAREWLDVSAELPSSGWATVCPTLDGASARLVRERLVKRAVACENALARLELARAITPEDTEVAYALALAMSLWERPEQGCAVSRRDADAVELWRAVRALDPSFEPEQVSTELALVYTRVGDLQAAVREYEGLVELTAHAPRRALLAHGNLAELLMMTGELRAAVAHYEAAVRFARDVDEPGALALSEFGLAAALDRLGERTQALAAARAAVDRSDDSLRVLRSDGVFFVPAYEVHFYEALGQESRADGSRVPLVSSRARGSRAESLASSIERALAAPLSPSELTALDLALAAWLRASAAVQETDTLAAEVSAGRSLALAIERTLAAAEARVRRERETRDATTLRTIDEGFDVGPSAEARVRLRVACLAAAARSWRRYLDEGGRDGPFAAHARAHLAQLAELIESEGQGSARRSPRRPRPGAR